MIDEQKTQELGFTWDIEALPIPCKLLKIPKNETEFRAFCKYFGIIKKAERTGEWPSIGEVIGEKDTHVALILDKPVFVVSIPRHILNAKEK